MVVHPTKSGPTNAILIELDATRWRCTGLLSRGLPFLLRALYPLDSGGPKVAVAAYKGATKSPTACLDAPYLSFLGVTGHAKVESVQAGKLNSASKARAAKQASRRSPPLVFTTSSNEKGRIAPGSAVGGDGEVVAIEVSTSGVPGGKGENS